MSFYYPEGYFGPICDSPVEDKRDRSIVIPPEDQYVPVFEEGDNWWYGIGDLTGIPPKLLLRMECKQKPDGTYFDCRYIYTDGTEEDNNKTGGISSEGFGLKDKFFVPEFGPESCSPFDPDINIRNRIYFLSDGTTVEKAKRGRSKPVTYAVDASSKFGLSSTALTATFNSAGTAVNVSGSGTGNVLLKLKWNDNPNTHGVAVGSISINDETGTTYTWIQSGERGSEENYISVEGGNTYNITFNGLNAANNPILVQDNDTKLCLKDGDNNDCNAEFTIETLENPVFTYEQYQWNPDGRNYGVWVNPEVCTLPGIEQEVTYEIDIEHTDTYAFSFGSDDRGTVVLNGTDTIFNNLAGGIFTTGSGRFPHTATRTLNRGKIKVTVSVTNAVLPPSSNSYSWAQNPGGWFLKICRGSVCATDTVISNWVFAGTNPKWSSLMNEYAVYPSNTDPLVGTAHTATWNIDFPDTDDYTLEVQADNTATVTLDGVQVATSSSFTTSTTVTLSNVSVGSHALGVSVTNNASASGTVGSWENNPGGIAWKITRPGSTTTETVATTETVNNDISATFDDNGNVVVTGVGSGRVQLLFKWDDNPNTNDTALGKLKIAGKTFVQTNGVRKGSDDYVFDATAGQTYTLNIIDNSGGFSKENNKKLCFRDRDGDDCNAELRITDVSSTGTIQNTTFEEVTTVVPTSQVASSLDLRTTSGVDSNNIIWHTRMAIGYEEYVV
ncbi:PA14 domain protein [Synechococcus phage S-BM1]|nr:PA14 domain protein [Synechococcus phage S-BM1]